MSTTYFSKVCLCNTLRYGRAYSIGDISKIERYFSRDINRIVEYVYAIISVLQFNDFDFDNSATV